MWLPLVLFCCLQFGVAVRPAPDLELLEIYKELNAAWFNGKLPEDHLRISWDSITERNGDIAFTWITNYEGEGERISIVLSPRMKNCESCTTGGRAPTDGNLGKAKDSDARRFAAIRDTLDGRPPQAVTGEGGGPMWVHVTIGRIGGGEGLAAGYCAQQHRPRYVTAR